MPRVSSFLLGMAVGAVLCFGATNYHVVRAQDGFHLVHKQPARLAEAYVDIRSFSVSDWTNHAELAAALAADNKQYLMEGAAANSVSAALEPLSNWPQQ